MLKRFQLFQNSIQLLNGPDEFSHWNNWNIWNEVVGG